MNHAHFTVELVEKDFRGNLWKCIFVRDVGKQRAAMSVTNDAEHVVKEAFNEFGDLPIMYRDSDGNIDELEHNNGTFTGYKSLGGTKDKCVAFNALAARHHQLQAA